MTNYYINSNDMRSPAKINGSNYSSFMDEGNRSFPQFLLDTNLDFFETFEIFPGFSMVTAKYYSANGLSMNFKNQNNKDICFCFCSAGTIKIRFNEKNHHLQSDMSVSAGNRVIYFLPDTEGVKELAPKQYHSMATIRINPTLFRHYIGNESNILSAELKKIFEGEDFNYFKKDNAPVPIQTIAHQILNCPFKGSARHLFMSSKALELLSFQIAYMSKKTESTYDKITLNQNDVDSIYIAKDLLLENVCDSPTLPQLAKLAGINISKLQAGFKRIFGIPVYSYLQQYRMENAKHLIEDGKLNVSEIAWNVGYINVSHFITAYRKKYGVNPGSYLRGKRKNTQLYHASH